MGTRFAPFGMYPDVTPEEAKRYSPRARRNHTEHAPARGPIHKTRPTAYIITIPGTTFEARFEHEPPQWYLDKLRRVHAGKWSRAKNLPHPIVTKEVE